MHVIHVNGGECTGIAFTHLLQALNIKVEVKTDKNLHSYVICEQRHQTNATVLKSLLLAKPPYTCCNTALQMDDAMVTNMHELHCMVSTTLQVMSGGLIFSQDILFVSQYSSHCRLAGNLTLATCQWHLVVCKQKYLNYGYQIGQKISIVWQYIKGKLNKNIFSHWDS